MEPEEPCNVYQSFPIFSAAHSDAQMACLEFLNTKAATIGSPCQEFRATVSRLKKFRQDSQLAEGGQGAKRNHRLGFSSQFESGMEEELSAFTNEKVAEVRDEIIYSEVPESYGPLSRTIPHCHGEATVGLEAAPGLKPVRGKPNARGHPGRLFDGNEPSRKHKVLANSDQPQALDRHEARNVPTWITIWFVLSSVTCIWDLFVMRAGTGRMLLEEAFLAYLPLQIPSHHWLASPIPEVFPFVTEAALNVTYLLSYVFYRQTALLLAFASAAVTVGQTLSVCLQAYFYPNFMSSPKNLSTISWALVLIFRIFIPTLIGFTTGKELCYWLGVSADWGSSIY
ncbi:hypothetical protein GYMLUDRAFT_77792 [Collybiopsis luxurians FD-317 M1]|uniref:Uncharacterized protein n=1 Tax=Collybiopsis luxurians FD-317 M1 TaxID=944289 RepID=A0A0D0AQB2_9AGAR|nr:hypothetical protein GYMLUDRAFT_77792 [Collybiopsis luxurians FD-317 M1]